MIILSVFIIILGGYLSINALWNYKILKEKFHKAHIISIFCLGIIFLSIGIATNVMFLPDIINSENKLVIAGMVQKIETEGTKSPTEVFYIKGVKLSNPGNIDIEVGEFYRVSYYKNSGIVDEVYQIE